MTPGYGETNLKTAALFPGQGSEYPGMLASIRDSRITREVFSPVNDAAGDDVLSIAANGSAERLLEPKIAQFAVIGTSIAYWHMLNGSYRFSFLAGHSLGFYSALYAAGALSLDDCLRVVSRVQETIEEMAAGSTGAMAAVFGLRSADVRKICLDSGNVFISHVNAATQIVISGERAAVRKAAGRALSSGALGVRQLAIAHPLHSPLMEGIEARLRSFVDSLDIREPGIPVMSHMDGSFLRTAGIRDVICGQLSRTVMWKDAVKKLSGEGVGTFVEVGPADVLAKLVRWIIRDAGSITAEEAVSCQAV